MLNISKKGGYKQNGNKLYIQVYGYNCFFYWDPNYNNYGISAKQIEIGLNTLNSINEKALYISKVQYDKEFDIYQEI